MLTCETLEEIDGRFATEPRVIEFYESVFINVRDQLQHRDWVSKVIVSARSSYRANQRGGMTDEQRGYVYRLFAYFGGPLALDAVITGIGPTTTASRMDDVDKWFEDELVQLVRTTAAVAASTLSIHPKNVLRVLKLRFAQTRTAKVREHVSDTEVENILKAVSAVGPRESAGPTTSR